MKTIELEKLEIEPGDWILDLGCGEGRHLRSLNSNTFTRTIGLDLDRDALRTGLEKSKSGINGNYPNPEGFIQGDALELPFSDAQFDTIICSEVLEHIDDYRDALDEINRILKPEGELAVSVPRWLPEKICWLLSDQYHEVEGGHVRIFHEDQLKKVVESRGLRCFDTHSAHALHSPFWWLQCLFWDNKESNPLVKAYESFLEWDLLTRPKLIRWLENALNPFIGKSVVMYFRKETS